MLPRVLLAYDVSDSVQLNAQAAEGFRLGGINDPLNQGLCSPEDLVTFGGRDSFDSETLWNYELGAKIGFADGRGQFNIAAFYADISDLQMPVVAGTCSSRIVFNVPEAHSTGVGVRAQRRADRPLRFRHFGDLHAVGDRHQRDVDHRRGDDDRGRHRGGQPPAVGA